MFIEQQLLGIKVLSLLGIKDAGLCSVAEE